MFTNLNGPVDELTGVHRQPRQVHADAPQGRAPRPRRSTLAGRLSAIKRNIPETNGGERQTPDDGPLTAAEPRRMKAGDAARSRARAGQFLPVSPEAAALSVVFSREPLTPTVNWPVRGVTLFM